MFDAHFQTARFKSTKECTLQLYRKKVLFFLVQRAIIMSNQYKTFTQKSAEGLILGHPTKGKKDMEISLNER